MRAAWLVGQLGELSAAAEGVVADVGEGGRGGELDEASAAEEGVLAHVAEA